MTDDHLSRAYQAIPPPTDHLSDEAWERFLDAALSPAERDAVIDHITRCAECARVYRGLVAFERDSAPLHGRDAGRRSASTWRWAGPLAAALAAVTIFVARPRVANAPSSVTPSGSPSPVAVVVAPPVAVAPLPVRVAQDRAVVYRGRGEDPAAFLKAFDEAVGPYRQGDYEEAARRLAALGAAFPGASEPPLYEGVSLLMAGHPASAAGRLAEAERRSAGTEWAPDAEYYAARARLEAGQYEGRATLNRLCASPGPYHQPACDALPSSPSSPSPLR
jgi:hypothetical protein